ncbi:glycosyltransferase family protein [Flavobacterium aurantiibacter]|nr:hypothetical protein [Flavobacterium aurantiibacter]
MNILFLISNYGGNGVGGHFHSLNQISQQVANDNEVKVISIGSKASPVITSNSHFHSHIQTSKGFKGISKVNSELKKVALTFKPDVVHCFDTESLNKVLLLPALFHLPIVLNKCGGRNPIGADYQHADGIVVFSVENLDWFASNSRYNQKNIFLIPNRVQKLTVLKEDQRQEQKVTNSINFLRISRLGGAYEKTLGDTFNLLTDLKSSFKVNLFVVGKVQDKARFEALERKGSQIGVEISYITDERAYKASDFIYLADFAIGTGRSFMEAASLGIPTLAPVANASVPILVTKNNFQHFLKFNFSERTILPQELVFESETFLKEVLADRTLYMQVQQQTLELFQNYFGTDLIASKYQEVYHHVTSSKNTRWSLVKKNYKYLLKYLILKRS